jgi:hypothetical protein
VKSVRHVRHMSKFLLSPSERMLLRFQRKAVIETDTSSADTDGAEWDPVKRLDSANPFTKLRQAHKVKRFINHLRSQTLEAGQRHALKGIFVKRPIKIYSGETPGMVRQGSKQLDPVEVRSSKAGLMNGADSEAWSPQKRSSKVAPDQKAVNKFTS